MKSAHALICHLFINLWSWSLWNKFLHFTLKLSRLKFSQFCQSYRLTRVFCSAVFLFIFLTMYTHNTTALDCDKKGWEPLLQCFLHVLLSLPNEYFDTNWADTKFVGPSRGRFHKSWAQGAYHQDRSIHLHPTPTPNFWEAYVQMLGAGRERLAQGAKQFIKSTPGPSSTCCWELLLYVILLHSMRGAYIKMKLLSKQHVF